MTTLREFRTVKRSSLEYVLLGLSVLVFVFGLARLLGQSGLVAGWAVLLTYLAESPGSLRQRVGGMLAFAAFGFIQILLAGFFGNSGWPLLVLLFAVSFVSSWMMGYGARAAQVGFVSNIWITLTPPLVDANDLVPSLFGFGTGSLLVIVASIIPPLFRGELMSGDQDGRLFLGRRGHRTTTLFSYSVIRALAITWGGFAGAQYLQLNPLWIALTVNLILPPVLKTTWARGMYRAVGTVLGAVVGFSLVSRLADNNTLLLVVGLITAFFVLYTAKGFIYGVFVFFLTVLYVTQFGLQGVDMARFGGNERVIATMIGVAIAFVIVPVLQLVVDRDAYRWRSDGGSLPKTSSN